MKVQYAENTHKIQSTEINTSPDGLFSAHQGSGTRKHILTRIMVSRSELDMKLIKNEYKKSYGKALYQEILVSKHLIQDNDYKPVLCVMNSSYFVNTYGNSQYNKLW